jgi:hypothetical protein
MGAHDCRDDIGPLRRRRYGLKIGLLIATTGGFIGSLFYWISSRSYAADLKKVEE